MASSSSSLAPQAFQAPLSLTYFLHPVDFPHPVVPVIVSCSWAACTGPSPAQGSLSAVSLGSPLLSPGNAYIEVFRKDKAFRSSQLLPSHPASPLSPPSTATLASARLSPTARQWLWPQPQGAWWQAGRKEGEKNEGCCIGSPAGNGNSEAAGPLGGFRGRGQLGSEGWA